MYSRPLLILSAALTVSHAYTHVHPDHVAMPPVHINQGTQLRQANHHEPAEPEEHRTGEEATDGDHAGMIVATGMFGTIVMLSMTFSMTSSTNKLISTHSWMVIDNVVAIFIAVMFYQAVDDVLEFCIAFPHHHVLASCLHATLLFFAVFFLSWKLKDQPVFLASLCGAGAHFVAFAYMHWTTAAVEHFAKDGFTTFIVFIFLCLVAAGFSYGVNLIKNTAQLDDENWNEQVTDFENDVNAMGLAIIWTLFVCYLIVGHPEDIEAFPGEVEHHRSFERTLILAYAVAVTLIALVIFAYLPHVDSRQSRLISRLSIFLSSFTAMSSAWGFVIWGHWLFYDHHFKQRPLFGCIFFALCASMCAGLGIVGLSVLEPRMLRATGSRAGPKVLLVAMSLVVGWSWEKSFDLAIEVIVEDFEHESPYLKVLLTCGLVALVMPTYLVFLKPGVLQKCEPADG